MSWTSIPDMYVVRGGLCQARSAWVPLVNNVRWVTTQLTRDNAIREFVYQPATTTKMLSSVDKVDYVVVMLGWLCAPFRPFIKYVELNNQFGMDVLMYLPPAKSLMLPFYGQRIMRERIEELAEYTKQREAKTGREVRYLFHVLSNNGAYHCALFFDELRLLTAGDLHSRFKGTVIDSAPSSASTDVFARAFTAGYFAWWRAFLTSHCPRVSSTWLASLTGANRHNAVYDHPVVTPMFRAYMKCISVVRPSAAAYMHSIDDAVNRMPSWFPSLHPSIVATTSPHLSALPPPHHQCQWMPTLT